MTPRQATRLIATAFVVTVALIAWRHVRDGAAPPPGAFLYPTAMFGGLALVADVGAPTFAAALAGALTVGIGFRFVEVGSVGGSAAVAGAGGSTGRRSITGRQGARSTRRSRPTRKPRNPAVRARKGR